MEAKFQIFCFVKVLEMMSDREFKNTRDVNEVDSKSTCFCLTSVQVMSLKYHIIHFIVKDMEKQLELDQKKVRDI